MSQSKAPVYNENAIGEASELAESAIKKGTTKDENLDGRYYFNLLGIEGFVYVGVAPLVGAPPLYIKQEDIPREKIRVHYPNVNCMRGNELAKELRHAIQTAALDYLGEDLIKLFGAHNISCGDFLTLQSYNENKNIYYNVLKFTYLTTQYYARETESNKVEIFDVKTKKLLEPEYHRSFIETITKLMEARTYNPEAFKYEQFFKLTYHPELNAYKTELHFQYNNIPFYARQTKEGIIEIFDGKTHNCLQFPKKFTQIIQSAFNERTYDQKLFRLYIQSLSNQNIQPSVTFKFNEYNLKATYAGRRPILTNMEQKPVDTLFINAFEKALKAHFDTNNAHRAFYKLTVNFNSADITFPNLPTLNCLVFEYGKKQYRLERNNEKILDCYEMENNEKIENQKCLDAITKAMKAKQIIAPTKVNQKELKVLPLTPGGHIEFLVSEKTYYFHSTGVFKNSAGGTIPHSNSFLVAFLTRLIGTEKSQEIKKKHSAVNDDYKKELSTEIEKKFKYYENDFKIKTVTINGELYFTYKDASFMCTLKQNNLVFYKQTINNSYEKIEHCEAFQKTFEETLSALNRDLPAREFFRYSNDQFAFPEKIKTRGELPFTFTEMNGKRQQLTAKYDYSIPGSPTIVFSDKQHEVKHSQEFLSVFSDTLRATHPNASIKDIFYPPRIGLKGKVFLSLLGIGSILGAGFSALFQPMASMLATTLLTPIFGAAAIAKISMGMLAVIFGGMVALASAAVALVTVGIIAAVQTYNAKPPAKSNEHELREIRVNDLTHGRGNAHVNQRDNKPPTDLGNFSGPLHTQSNSRHKPPKKTSNANAQTQKPVGLNNSS